MNGFKRTKAKMNAKEKFPNLIGYSVKGFDVRFADGCEIRHPGGLITLDPDMVVLHGRITRAEAY